MKKIKVLKLLLTFLPVYLTPAFGQITGLDSLTISLIGHAHIDLSYRWRWNETIDRVLPDTYLGVLKMMEKEKGLTFVQSQMAIYDELRKNYPALFEAIKTQINKGSWIVVGGQWSETDEILPSGESFIRQFLISNEFKEKYIGGPPVSIARSPDAFAGHAATLPKIYKGCGIKNYVFMRSPPENKRLFWWQAADSSRIFAYAVPKHYNIEIKENMLEEIRNWYNITKYKDVMVLFGEGDHGGGPRGTDFEAINKLKKLAYFPKMVCSTPESYFSKLSASNLSWPVQATEFGVSGSSLNGTPWWNGCYTSQVRVKKLIREAENNLVVAETMATIGSSLQGKPFSPRVDFREAWKILLRNESHDVFAGTCVGDAADDAVHDLNQVNKEAARLLAFGLETIGTRIETEGTGIPLVVFNPCSWKRTGVVSAVVKNIEAPKSFKISDHKGIAIPFSIDSISADKLMYCISFLAKDIPSMGYKLYRVLPAKTKPVAKNMTVLKRTAENEFFKIAWNDEGVSSIWDKKLAKEILSATANTLCLEEDLGSAWQINLTGKQAALTRLRGPEVIEHSAIRTVVQWTDRSESSLFIRQVILEQGISQVKFRIKIDWHESDRLLKLAFPVNVKGGKAFYEQPYGYVERTLSNMENPTHNWVDLSNEEWGVALLNNGRYGFNINEGLLQISVIRGARDMDPRMDEGLHTFEYALVSHSGDWRESKIVQEGVGFNQPLLTVQETIHRGTVKGWTSDISLPGEKSFYNISSDHVMLSSLKVLQGDWSPENTILRLTETEGKGGEVIVSLPKKPGRVIETDHLEKPLASQPKIEIQEQGFKFTIGHDQIRTFIVEYDVLQKE